MKRSGVLSPTRRSSSAPIGNAASKAVLRGFGDFGTGFRRTTGGRESVQGSSETAWIRRSRRLRLLALYQGVLVLVRGGYDLKLVRRAIDLEFDGLEGGFP